MTFSPTKFEVAISCGLGGDAFTRNVTDGRRTDFGTKLRYPFFSKEKSGYNEKRVTNSLDPDQDQTLVINQQGTEVATSKERYNLLPHRDTF